MAAVERQPTIRDVAHAAGVSVSTVSKYMTGRPYVSEHTGARVRRAVERLNYHPNAVARALATGRTRVIGVVVPSLANPFYTELVVAVDREAARAGFSIFLTCTEGDPAREHDIMAAMLDKGVDGFVLAHAAASDRETLERVLRGKAFVFASRHVEHSDEDYVVVDGAAGSRLAVRHLAGLGHTRIAFVSGPSSVVQFRWRREGFCGGLRELGLEPDPALMLDGDGDDWLDIGAQAADRLLALAPERRPTAVHTANDVLALGLLGRCRERGVRVPDDLSVVGFDNVVFGAVAAVPVTTIDSRLEQIGIAATRVLLDRLLGRGPAAPVQQVLAPALVVRESSGPAPAGPSPRASVTVAA